MDEEIDRSVGKLLPGSLLLNESGEENDEVNFLFVLGDSFDIFVIIILIF
jgi:hypothetical protein